MMKKTVSVKNDSKLRTSEKSQTRLGKTYSFNPNSKTCSLLLHQVILKLFLANAGLLLLDMGATSVQIF